MRQLLLLVWLLSVKGCPPGWSKVSGAGRGGTPYCLMVTTKSGPWEDGADTCAAETPGGTLASVGSSSDDWRDVTRLVPPGEQVWVGVSRLDYIRETGWQFGPYSNVSTNPKWPLWASGEPSNGDVTKRCACIAGSGLAFSCACPEVGDQATIVVTRTPPCAADAVMDATGSQCFTVENGPLLDSSPALASLRSADDGKAVARALAAVLPGKFGLISLFKSDYAAFSTVDGAEVPESSWRVFEPDINSCSYVGGPCKGNFLCDADCTASKPTLCVYPQDPVTRKCPSKWTKAAGACYARLSKSAPWSSSSCDVVTPNRLKARLATPTPSDLKALLAYSSLRPSQGMWVGMSRLPYDRREEAWGWGVKDPMPYLSPEKSLWKARRPTGSLDCAFLEAAAGKLSNRPCSDTIGSLCETKGASTCPGGWLDQNAGICYTADSASVKWGGTTCTLARIPSKASLKSIASSFSSDLWVGLQNLERLRHWKWVNESVDYTWDIWDLPHVADAMDCGYTGGSCSAGKMCAAACTVANRYLCEAPAMVDTDAPPVQSPAPASPAPRTASPSHAPHTVSPSHAPHTAPPSPVPKSAPKTEPPPTHSPPPVLETMPPITLSLQPLTNQPTPLPSLQLTDPPTPQPDTPDVIPGTEETEGMAQVVGGVGIITSLTDPSNAVYASQVSLVLSAECMPDTDWSRVSRIMHPTQVAVSGNLYAGAIVMNLVLVAAFIALHSLIVVVAGHSPCVSSFLSAQGLLRFPSAGLVLFFFLYQGTSYCSLHLLSHAPSWLFAVLGVVGGVLCFAVPLVTALRLSRISPWSWTGSFNADARCRYLEDPKSASHSVVRWFLGPGEWVSIDREIKWNDRYTAVLRPYTERRAWCGALIKFGTMMLLSVCNTPSTPTLIACGHVKLACGVVYLMQIMLFAHLKPFCRRRDHFLEILISACFCFSLLFLAAGFYMQVPKDDPVFLWGAALARAALFVLLVKICADAVSEVFLLFTGRRNRLQGQEWKDPKVSFQQGSLLDEAELYVQVADLGGEDLTATPVTTSVHPTLPPSRNPVFPSSFYSSHGLSAYDTPRTSYANLYTGFFSAPSVISSGVPNAGSFASQNGNHTTRPSDEIRQTLL